MTCRSNLAHGLFLYDPQTKNDFHLLRGYEKTGKQANK